MEMGLLFLLTPFVKELMNAYNLTLSPISPNSWEGGNNSSLGPLRDAWDPTNPHPMAKYVWVSRDDGRGEQPGLVVLPGPTGLPDFTRPSHFSEWLQEEIRLFIFWRRLGDSDHAAGY